MIIVVIEPMSVSEHDIQLMFVDYVLTKLS